jgi:hypothetical protein
VLAATAREWAAGGIDVVVLAVSLDDTLAPAQRFFGAQDLDGLIFVHDPAARSTFGVPALPTTWVIDPRGELVLTHTGWSNEALALADEAVRSAAAATPQ